MLRAARGARAAGAPEAGSAEERPRGWGALNRALAVAAAVVLASACRGGAGDLPSPRGLPADLEPGTTWRLVSMDGQPLPARPMVTLEVDSTQVGGFSGCNAYGGPATFGPGDSLRVHEISSTAAACPEPAGLMEREAELLRRLGGVVRVRREGERLVLESLSVEEADGTLVFEPLPESVGDPASLVGIPWRVASLDGRAPRGVYTLAFSADGVVVGRAGCRAILATYRVAEGRISFPQKHMAGEPCDALAAEEGAFTDALTWGSWFTIAQDRWSLRTPRGETLELVRLGETAPVAGGDWELLGIRTDPEGPLEPVLEGDARVEPLRAAARDTLVAGDVRWLGAGSGKGLLYARRSAR